MPKNKSEDFKMSAVEYYLTEDVHKNKYVKYLSVVQEV
jgi:hypothetical protein